MSHYGKSIVDGAQAVAIGTPVVHVDGSSVGFVAGYEAGRLEVQTAGHDRYRLGLDEVRRVGGKAICVVIEPDALEDHKLSGTSDAPRGSAAEALSVDGPRRSRVTSRTLRVAPLILGAVGAAAGLELARRRRRADAPRPTRFLRAVDRLVS